MLAIYLIAFLVLITLSVPIAFSLGLATVTVFWLDGQPLSLSRSGSGPGWTSSRWSPCRCSSLPES